MQGDGEWGWHSRILCTPKVPSTLGYKTRWPPEVPINPDHFNYTDVVQHIFFFRKDPMSDKSITTYCWFVPICWHVSSMFIDSVSFKKWKTFTSKQLSEHINSRECFRFLFKKRFYPRAHNSSFRIWTTYILKHIEHLRHI